MLTARGNPSRLFRRPFIQLGRIVAAAAQRIAADDPPDSLKRAPHRPVFLDGIDHVVAARRPEPAVPAHNRAQRELIHTHDRDDRPSRKSHNRADDPHTVSLPLPRLLVPASRLLTLFPYPLSPIPCSLLNPEP